MVEPASNHFDSAGDPRMVDVSHKSSSLRLAVAESWIELSDTALTAIQTGHSKKGDVLAVARLAAIMAAKQTSTLIPLCHAIPIEAVDVSFEVVAPHHVRCTVAVKSTGRTGVEMEALTAASVAALTIYDMCKSFDKGMEIGPIRLIEKSGGVSGSFSRSSSKADSTHPK